VKQLIMRRHGLFSGLIHPVRIPEKEIVRRNQTPVIKVSKRPDGHDSSWPTLRMLVIQ
jgi:hypothetical protein